MKAASSRTVTTASDRREAEAGELAPPSNGNGSAAHAAPLAPKPIVSPGRAAALSYAARGWHVVPIWGVVDGVCQCPKGKACESPGKHPSCAHAVLGATRDPKVIRAWWQRRVKPGAIGIAAGPSGLLIIDVDDAEGEVALRAHGPLPKTVTTITRRGHHYYFRRPDGLEIDNGSGSRIGRHIDVRGPGFQVLAPPSPHPSGECVYRFAEGLGPDDVEVAEVPDHLLPLVTKNRAGPAHPPAATGKRKITEGERDNILFKKASSLQGQGWAPKAIEAALVEENEAACDPPLPERRVREIARGVVKRYDEGDDPSSIPDWVKEMNKTYFVVRERGSVLLCLESHDTVLNRDVIDFMKPESFRLLHNNHQVVVGTTAKGADIKVGAGTAWLTHRDRLLYPNGFVMKPAVPVEGAYDLWKGLGVEPRPGEWPKIKWHIRNIICSGNEKHYRWLINWIAWAVQHPELHAEVAVVLRGLEGVGKGWLGQLLLKIFRHHGIHLTNQCQFNTRFNRHYVNGCFIFVDEAFYAGDKAGDGMMKGLITEHTIQMEAKGMDIITMPNRLKILMSSNNEWVIPAGREARRYFMLDVSEKKIRNAAYFKDLFAETDLELPGFLHDLLAMDLSDFDHRHVEHTEALHSQKLLGADSFVRFWYDCLYNGEIKSTTTSRSDGPDGDDIFYAEAVGWPDRLAAQVLYARYLQHARHDRHPLSSAQMGQRLLQLLPEVKRSRTKAKVPPGIVPPGGPVKKPKTYSFPGLGACRKSFLKFMKIEGPWEWPRE